MPVRGAACHNRPSMGASITVPYRIAWMDTDAAGIWHYSTAIRMAEAAERELFRGLDISRQSFGSTPRVHIEFDFVRPVEFDDLVQVTLCVAEVGRSSITYEIRIAAEVGEVATGSIVAVLLDPATGSSKPWPAEVRSRLSAGSG